MKYCLIKRAVNAIVVDDDDVDRDPETIKVCGKVTFTPQVNDGDIIQYAGVDGVTSMVLPPITVSISDGEIMHRGGVGVKLAAGGPGCNPKTIRWRADFTNMQAGGWAFNLKPVVFDAIPDGEVDLTIVAPLASTSEPITRGPAGVSVSNITVDGSYLVFTGTSEAGSSELARIPLEPVVEVVSTQAVEAAARAEQAESNAGDFASVATTAAAEAVDAMDAAARSAAAFSIYTGTGSPEGRVTAPVGAVYTDSAATAGAVRWIKTSGTGNTGWQVEYGDTGWRALPRPEMFSGGGFKLSRNGNYVHAIIHAATLASNLPAGQEFITFPPGFRTASAFRVPAQDAYLDVRSNGGIAQIATNLSAGNIVSFGAVYRTSDPWPTTLPGYPA